ncbi:Uncharacterised protein [Moraxella caviae]|nr:Uncharacterised protein [Moraxella caviae]
MLGSLYDEFLIKLFLPSYNLLVRLNLYGLLQTSFFTKPALQQIAFYKASFIQGYFYQSQL